MPSCLRGCVNTGKAQWCERQAEDSVQFIDKKMETT